MTPSADLIRTMHAHACYAHCAIDYTAASLNGRPVVAGLPVPTDDLIPVAGGPS